MKLRTLRRYRNQGHGLFLEPGEVLRTDDDTAAWLQRDAPGSFEVADDGAPASKRAAASAATQAPDRATMAAREKAERDVSEHLPASVMTPGGARGGVRNRAAP